MTNSHSLYTGFLIAVVLASPLAAQESSVKNTAATEAAAKAAEEAAAEKAAAEEVALKELCADIRKSPQSVDEAKMISALDKAKEMNRPFAVTSSLRRYLDVQTKFSSTLHKKAIENALMTGDYSTALVRCKVYLTGAKPGAEASAVAETLYWLQIDILGVPDDAYRSMSGETDKLISKTAARKYDAWYLAVAQGRQDLVNWARRMADICSSGLPSVQIEQLHGTSIESLLKAARIPSKDNAEAVPLLKRLAAVIAGDDRTKLRCAFYAANTEYALLANGKDQAHRDKEFAPVLAAANAYLAKFHTADVLYDIMTTVCLNSSGQVDTKYFHDENQGLLKRAFFVSAMAKLPEDQRKDILARANATSFADLAQWAQLVAKYPTAFQGCPRLDHFPFDMRSKSQQDYTTLARAFEGTNSFRAAVVRSLAAGGDLRTCMNRLATNEAWSLDSYNQAQTLTMNDIWESFRACNRGEKDQFSDSYRQAAIFKFGADHIANSPMALDPNAASQYLYAAWSSLRGEKGDPAKMAECLNSLAWVPYTPQDRKNVFRSSYDQFVHWTNEIRNNEKNAKRESKAAEAEVKTATDAVERVKREMAKPNLNADHLAGLKGNLADAEKRLVEVRTRLTERTDALAAVTAQLAKISPLEEAFKRVMDPNNKGTGPAPNDLCRELSTAVRAVRKKDSNAFQAAARKLYPMVKEYDITKPILGKAVFNSLFSAPNEIDAFQFQLEALTDQLSRYNPSSKFAALRLKTVVDAIFRNPKWSGGSFSAADKDKALTLNDVFAKALAKEIAAGRFSPELFEYVRKTRRGNGWGHTQEEIPRNQELIEQMIEKNVLAQSDWRPYGRFPSTSYMWLVRNEFTGLAKKCPVESYFDDMFVVEALKAGYVDETYYHNGGQDSERKINNAAARIIGDNTTIPVDGRPSKLSRTRAEYLSTQNRALNADPEVRDAALAKVGACYGKTRFDDFARGSWKFSRLGNAAEPEVRKAYFAATSAYFDLAEASPSRAACPSLSWLGQLDVAAQPLTDVELDVLLRAFSPKIIASTDATFASRLVEGLKASDRYSDFYDIAPYLWKIAAIDDGFERKMIGQIADFHQKGQLDLEAVYSGVGLDLFGAQLRESNQNRLRIARSQVLLKVDGITPVDRSSPIYSILVAQADYLSGNLQRAWQGYMSSRQLALDAARQLDPAFCVWLIRRNTELGEFDTAEDLAREALRWMETESDNFAPEIRAQLLLAYADIAYQRPEYPRARALYGRIASAKEFAGTKAQITAELQIAEVDRVTKHYSEAIQRLEKLERRKDRFAQREAHYFMAKVLFDQEQYVEALEETGKVFAYDPTHAAARIFEGRINLQLKRLERASRIKVGFSTDEEYIVPGKPLRIGLQDRTLAVAGDTMAIEMRVWTDSGDEEYFNLVPFADSKTQFEGQIHTALAPVAKGDHTIQVLGKDRVHYDFSESFKTAHNITETVDHPLHVISDSNLFASSGKILSNTEMEEQALERMLRARLKLKQEEDKNLSLGDFRPHDQVKPGNPINVRVIDPDQSTTTQNDTVEVTLATTSGDKVAFDLKETDTHSGIYEGAIPTASASATAFASDSTLGSQPTFAISAGDHPAWVAQPDGRRPKTFSIDLNASEKLGSMKIDAAVPGRKLKQFMIQTSVDGKDFQAVGSWPSKETVWNGAPRVVQVVSEGSSIGSLGEMRQALSTATPDKRKITALEKSALKLNSGEKAEYAHVMAAFHLPKRQMTMLQLKPKTERGTAKYTMLVDGRPAEALAVDEDSSEEPTLQSKVLLGQGVHQIDIFVQLGSNSTVAIELFRDTDKPPYLEACPMEMFDPEKNPMIAKRFAEMSVDITAAEDGGSFEVEFGSEVRTRVIRLLLADFETDAPAISKIHLTAKDGRQLLPSKVDLLALKTNDILEIVPGDQISIVYKDPHCISEDHRIREAFLSATYANGQLNAALLTGFELDSEGMRRPTYVPLRRFKPEDAICVVINDADCDTSGELDTVTFTARTGDGEPVELPALETEKHSGVFIGKIFVAEGESQRKSEIHVAEGEDLVISYLDEENTEPGIPWERTTTIESVVYFDPELRVYDTKSSLLDEEEIAAEMQKVSDSEYVPATRTLATVRPEKADGADKPSGVIGVPVLCELVWPTIVQTAKSTAEVYVQTSSGRKAYGKDLGGEFDINVPGTIKIVESPGNASGGAAPAGYRSFVVVGDPGALDAMDDGRFMFTIPMRLGSLPEKSYAVEKEEDDTSKEKQAATLIEEDIDSLVVRGGDEIFIGFKYVDDEGKTKWITRKVALTGDAFFNVMDRQYGKQVAGVYVGDSAHFRVIDPAKDLTDERDHVSVELETTSGSKRKLDLIETFEHSGVFKGPIEFAYAGKGENPELRGAIGVKYGEKVANVYMPKEGEERLTCSIEIFKGADGEVQPFTKRFDDPLVAVRTRLTIAEAYFELAKKHRRMGQGELTEKEIATGKRLLEEALRDYPDTEARAQVDYLLANLSLEFAEEADEKDVKKKHYLEALSRFASIVATYRDSTYAPKAQYKKALTLERMGQIDRACEEYVKLSYRWPDDPLIAETIARLGQYFFRKGLTLTKRAAVAKKEAAELTGTEDDKAEAKKVSAEDGEKAAKLLLAAGKDELQAKESYITAAKVYGRLAVRFPSHRLADKSTAVSAQCYLRALEYDEAVSVFLKVIRNDRADNDLRAESLYWAAECYMRKGGGRSSSEKDLKEAYMLFKELTLYYPESKWARYARSRLTGENLSVYDVSVEESE